MFSRCDADPVADLDHASFRRLEWNNFSPLRSRADNAALTFAYPLHRGPSLRVRSARLWRLWLGEMPPCRAGFLVTAPSSVNRTARLRIDTGRTVFRRDHAFGGEPVGTPSPSYRRCAG